MEASGRNIVVVEDDRKTSALMGLYLQREGFCTSFVYDGAEALGALERLMPDLMILDLLLPNVDGWQLCREIRNRSSLPILMVTARGEESERVLGFSLGADDYMVKPFSPREMVERVKAVLRRVRQPGSTTAPVHVLGDLRVDCARHRVTLSGETLALTASEYRMLALLIATPGRLFTRSQLLRQLYPSGEEVVERVVDVHIGKLRSKLAAVSDRPWIHTIRGTGYRMAEEPEL
ncbi:MAG: response regulator transcription factor [Bryobacteraceae bacterium]|nr:response regulator transcription factor [Bryobacteraceae bacterium]